MAVVKMRATHQCTGVVKEGKHAQRKGAQIAHVVNVYIWQTRIDGTFWIGGSRIWGRLGTAASEKHDWFEKTSLNLFLKAYVHARE